MMRGKCAAIPAVTIQAAEKAMASSTIVRSNGTGSSTAFRVAARSVGRGSSRKLQGRPITTCAAAHNRQVSRQPIPAAPQAVSGQATVLAKPASSVMPVIAPRASLP